MRTRAPSRPRRPSAAGAEALPPFGDELTRRARAHLPSPINRAGDHRRSAGAPEDSRQRAHSGRPAPPSRSAAA